MLWVPAASGTKPLPVFVMLHGCTQNPTDFATGTKMNPYGDQYNFFVVYPEQTSSANSNKCWNWFEPAHQARGSGEPALITSIALSLATKYQIDNTSIYVGGLSAGAAMADILGVTYPDVYRGAAVGAGLEYKAATTMVGAFSAMTSGGPAPATQGQVAYTAMGKYAQTLNVLVIHGTSDYTVYPVNGQQVVSSYAKNLDYVLGNGKSNGYITDKPTTTTPGQVPSGRAYTTYTYANSQTAQTLIQYVTVTGMGHAWSGGSSSGSYTDPQGPDASLLMVQFFLNSSVKPTTSTSGSGATTTAAATTSATASVATSSASATSTSSSGTSSSSTSGGKTLVFTSIASEDGFAGKLPVDGFSTTICQAGGKGAYTLDDYRIILSFDTSSLPASFSSAVLTITRQSVSGSVKPLIVDLKAGTFGPTTALTQMSYYGSPSALNIGTIPIPTADGSTSTFNIPAAALTYIKAASTRTQIMLRQDLVSSPPSTSPSILQIFDGQATLTVTL
jgi:poly(hydroxyalkanoate) depolymerase family esterase